MKKRVKKCMGFILAELMLVCLFCMTAVADENVASKDAKGVVRVYVEGMDGSIGFGTAF